MQCRNSHGLIVRCISTFTIGVCALVSVSATAVEPPQTAEQNVRPIVRKITSRLRWSRGIALDVGPGDGHLAREIVAATELVVHGVEPDGANAMALRRAFQSAGIDGSRLVVQQGRLDRLAYPDRSANLVICGDEFISGPRGRSAREIHRVLSPNGIAVVGRGAAVKGAEALTRQQLEAWLADGGVTTFEIDESDGLWAIITHEASAGDDEWTHRNHDAANTLASRDEIPFTTYRPQWMADYRPGLASAAVAVAGGRVIVAGLSYPEHPDTTPYVQVLDAFTGVELWARVGHKELPIDAPPGTYGNREFCCNYAVAGDTFYFLGNQLCHAIDLKDGVISRSLPIPAEAEPTKDDVWLHVACVGDALFGGVGESPNVVVDWNSMNYRGRCRAVFSIDRKTGRPNWVKKVSASTSSLTITGDRLYYCDPDLTLHALDSATGSEVWSRPTELPKGSEVAGCAAYLDRLWVLYNPPLLDRRGGLLTGAGLLKAGHNRRMLDSFATDDGRHLFACDFGIPVAGFTFAGNEVLGTQQHSSGLSSVDVATGKRNWLRTNWRLKCTASLATPNCLIYRSTETSILDLTSVSSEDSAAQPRTSFFGGFRPTCTFAAIPAHGMFFIQAPGCRCPSPIRASITLAPGEPAEPIAAADRKISGEAFDRKIDELPDEPVWATWRADRRHSGRVEGTIMLPLRQTWSVKLNREPSPLCAARGLVFVGMRDGAVRALDASSGEPRWTYPAGAAIQGSPFLWQGRLYVGDADGWVHCLRQDDGGSIWRFRAARATDRLVDHGRFASIWPVAGGVLVHEGTAYFAAGRLPSEGTMVHAVDARTGEAKWETTTVESAAKYTQGFVPGGPLAMNDDRLFISTPEAAPWQIELKGSEHRPTPVKPLLFGSRRGGPEVMVADDQLVSVIAARQYVWHVKYVAEDNTQRLPVVTDNAVVLLNRTVDGQKDRCLAAIARTMPSSTEKERVVWTAWPGEAMDTQIAVGDVLISAGESKIYATRISDGKELWSGSVTSPVFDLAFHGGRLFAACRSGEVLCFEK